MPPYRTYEVTGLPQMALQPTREDRRDRRRDAVDFGPPVQNTPHMVVRLDAHRDVVGLGLPQNSLPQYLQPGVVPPAVLRGLPPLPALSPHAPSLWAFHPYSFLGLASLGSGNLQPHPLPSTCAECKMDEVIASEYKKFTGEPFPVAPDSMPVSKYIGPRRGEMHVRFVSETTLRSGVLVTDLLRFKDLKDPQYKLVQHKGGPIKVTLLIEGRSPIEDIIYANCCHREITRLQLAWALACSFHRLAETFGLSPEGLMLTLFASGNKRTTWTAYARY
ncbi:hypothetical protein MSAN_00855000 [Mycena sanguinolenta]|uniref:Uncharacterized protein n=1 Tax=Mycena sanguinolenta TaxID=230812 RepID=A0A8H7DCK2_9AGAR|nr:hypothetical protein MSAN_00855000 [Mycena sanguinolenta]